MGPSHFTIVHLEMISAGLLVVMDNIVCLTPLALVNRKTNTGPEIATDTVANATSFPVLATKLLLTFAKLATEVQDDLFPEFFFPVILAK